MHKTNCIQLLQVKLFICIRPHSSKKLFQEWYNQYLLLHTQSNANECKGNKYRFISQGEFCIFWHFYFTSLRFPFRFHLDFVSQFQFMFWALRFVFFSSPAYLFHISYSYFLSAGTMLMQTAQNGKFGVHFYWHIQPASDAIALIRFYVRDKLSHNILPFIFDASELMELGQPIFAKINYQNKFNLRTIRKEQRKIWCSRRNSSAQLVGTCSAYKEIPYGALRNSITSLKYKHRHRSRRRARIFQDCTKCCDTLIRCQNWFKDAIHCGNNKRFRPEKKKCDLKWSQNTCYSCAPNSTVEFRFCGQTNASKQIFDFSQVTLKQLTFPYVYYAIHFYKVINHFRTKRFREIRLLLILFRCASRMRLFVPIQMHQCMIWKTVAQHQSALHGITLIEWRTTTEQTKDRLMSFIFMSLSFDRVSFRF